MSSDSTGGSFARARAVVRSALVAACVAFVALPVARADGPRPKVGVAVPAWALPVDVPEPAGRCSRGIEGLVHDVQWHVEQGRSVRFARVAYRLCNTSGVANASELAIDFGSDEAMSFHHVRRTRDGATVDLLDEAAVRTIQPESRLGEGLYDESRSALFFLEDVRVGDVIEYAYSIGTDDVAGRFVERERLGTLGTRLRRLVAAWPEGRAIRARVHDAPEGYSVEEGATGIRLEARDVESIDPLEDAPAWFVPGGFLELSEFADWAEVARWAAPHYVVPDASAALERVPMDRFRAAGSSDAERAEAALRFVQDEIRYLGLEMGERALVPHPPELVARRRYGDCKDKSLLLLVILRALGVEADAALVHTTRGHAIGEELPSPLAFNHVVVRARIGGQDVWLDPTRTGERGPIEARPPLLVEQALPARLDTTSLVPVPIVAPSHPELEVEERFTVHGNQATLRVVTKHRGFEAASFRAELEGEDLESMERRYLEFYAERDLEPRVLEPLRVEEADDGSVVVTEEYRIGRFWVDEERDVSAWPLEELLRPPSEGRADAPLGLPFPIHVLHRAVVELPEGWTVASSEERVASEAFEVSRDVSVDRRTLTIETKLRTLAPHVPARAVRAFRARARDARELTAFVLTAPAAVARVGARPASGWLGVALAALGVAVIAIAMRRRREEPVARGAPEPAGESPAAAIPVESAEHAARRHRSARCCEGSLAGGRWTEARLAGAALFVHSVECAACGRIHRRYYRQAT